MSDNVIYLDRFRLREGVLSKFERYATELTEFVEANVPGVTSFGFYLDEDAAEGTAVFVFADAESLDLHLDLASSRFQEGADLLESADINSSVDQVTEPPN